MEHLDEALGSIEVFLDITSHLWSQYDDAQFRYMIPFLLMEILEKHVDWNEYHAGIVEVLEHLSFQSKPLSDLELFRQSAQSRRFSVFSKEQAAAIGCWIELVRDWNDLRHLRPVCRAALTYWRQRAGSEGDPASVNDPVGRDPRKTPLAPIESHGPDPRIHPRSTRRASGSTTYQGGRRRKEERVRQALRAAFADAPCPSEAAARVAASHELLLAAANDTVLRYSNAEIAYMLPFMLLDILDHPAGWDDPPDPGGSVLAELDIGSSSAPDQLRDAQAFHESRYSAYTRAQASAVVAWLEMAQSWNWVTYYSAECALEYWRRRAAVK
jgi:hypothetical protein